VRNSEPGFAGLDFQARLRWEAQYATCARPGNVAADFIDRVAAAGAADPAATAGDLVSAIKDRLIGEPALDGGAAAGAEHAALVAIVGPLDAPAAGVPVSALRTVCGALLDSPQFLLQGIAGRGGDPPRLTPADASYAAVCRDLQSRASGSDFTVQCGDRALTLVAPTTHTPARLR
jgi:hypothetical protein